LCYTPFVRISAVFAESGDSVVRAGFLVLFIREKYEKKRIMIYLSFCLDTKGPKDQACAIPQPALPLGENTIRVVPLQWNGNVIQ
jgi:hypothetical protein